MSAPAASELPAGLRDWPTSMQAARQLLET